MSTINLPAVILGKSLEPYHEGASVEILSEVRRKHLAVFGATGAGKSHLVRSMIASDILAGHGVTVVDPHGELVDGLLANHIPKSRMEDVIVLNAKDRDRALSINILDAPRPEQRALVVSNAMNVFETLWRDSWGPRMSDILRNALFVLIEQPFPASLVALPTLLTNNGFRASMLKRVRDPIVLDFFHSTYDRWHDSFREEAISPVLNKVRAFLTNPLVRAIVGKAPSSFDFRRAMDERKIILCDLSKGAIGADNARLLGSLIVMQAKLAAFSRSDIPEAERVDHFLYVEEAHSFIGDVESILAESRKYRLNLTLILQSYRQLSEEAQSAVFTNSGSLISFRVSNADAERLSSEFGLAIPAPALQELEDYTAYVRTLVCDDTHCWPNQPEKFATYPPTSRKRGMASKERIIRLSNLRYTKPRHAVDDHIARFFARTVRPSPERVLGTRPERLQAGSQ